MAANNPAIKTVKVPPYQLISIWGCLFLLLTACTILTPTPALLTETAADSSVTPRPTYTSPFIPTRTPAPTNTPTQTYTEEERQARRLLNAKAYDMFDCEASFPGCNGTFALRVLEFLHTYPNSRFRAALIEHVVDTQVNGAWRLDYEWLVDEWVEQALVKPFQAANGLPEGFAESWQRGSITPGDLDNDGKTDYVVIARSLPATDALSPIWLYWLYAQNNVWRAERLAQVVAIGEIKVLSIQDVNGDGQADLAYTLTLCGASDCFEYLYLFTRQEEGWKRLPVLTQYGGNESAQNGGWSFSPVTDGSTRLVMKKGGAGSYMFGPIISYQIDFRWQAEAFIPVSISADFSSDWLDTLRIQWADRLVASRRFTETIPVLNNVLEQRGIGDEIQLDYHPFVLFRLGMAHLYLGQPAEAGSAWAKLVQEYPHMAISKDVSHLSTLIDQPNPTWQICDWYLRERPDWKPQNLEHPLSTYPYGVKYPFDVDTWCDSWLLVMEQPWVNTIPLEEQAIQLKLDWQQLSDDYDLNRDGLDDPIVTIEGEAWAFLSEGEHYQPLYAESSLPVEAIREPFHGLRSYPDERTLQVADLDGNDSPEIWVFEDSRIFAWIWQGRHFEGQWDQFHLGDKGYRGKARLADGVVKVRIAEYPYAEERVIGELIYQLVDGKFQRVVPPEQRNRSMDILSTAIEALYRQDSPQQALKLLEGFTPHAADREWNDDPMKPDWFVDADWEQAAACALRALAHEHLGDHAAALQEWQLILKKYPQQLAWVGLAVELGGLRWPPTPVPSPTVLSLHTPIPSVRR